MKNKKLYYYLIIFLIVIIFLTKYFKINFELGKDDKPELTNNVSEYLDENLIIITVWSNECVPCIKEIPIVNKLIHKYKDSSIVFISFNVSNDKKKMFKLLTKSKSNAIEASTIFTYYNEFYKNNDVENSFFNSEVIPKTIFVKKSKLLEFKTGSLTEEELDNLIIKNL